MRATLESKRFGISINKKVKRQIKEVKRDRKAAADTQ